MLRRNFLARFTMSTVSAALVRGGSQFACATEADTGAGVAAKLERISISTWSLHNYFRATRRHDFNLPGPMVTLPEFPELIVNRYPVRHLEFCAVHFDSTEPAYVSRVKAALARTHSVVVNLVLDIPEGGAHGTFSDPDPQRRAVAVDAFKHWVDVAHALGAQSVRASPGKADPRNMAPTVDSFEAIAAYARERGIGVMVENVHNFGTDHPEEIVELIKLTGPSGIGALPDFANFPDPATRQRGLKMLFPFAQTVCHAKGQEFNAHGVERTFDFLQAMQIAHAAGFKGIYSIEFNGPGDPYTGIQNTLNELLKYL